MKNPSKSLTCCLTLLLLAALGCQKDDVENIISGNVETTASTSYKVISLNEVPKLKPLLENIRKSQKDHSALARGETYMGVDSVLVDKVIQITHNGVSTYSFGIHTDFDNTGYIENLHLLEKGEDYIGFIIRYDTPIGWENDSSNYTPEGDLVLDPSNFNGYVTKFSLDRQIIWTSDPALLGRGNMSSGCTYVIHDMCNNDGHGGLGSSHIKGENCVGYPTGYFWQQGEWVCEEVDWFDTEFEDATSPTGGGGGGSGGSTTEGCFPVVGSIMDGGTLTSSIEQSCAENVEIGTVQLEDSEDYISDCNLLNELSNNSSFQQRMQELLTHMQNDSTEVGYYGRMFNGALTYHINDRFEGQPNVVGVDAPNPVTPIDSFIHNHFNNGNGTLSVFSGSDFTALYQLYNEGLISDLDTFVMVVATPGNDVNSTTDDTVYAVTISNKQQFESVASILAIDPMVIDSYYLKTNTLIHHNISTSLNEERLARLFQDRKFGMSLYRGDRNNLNQWTRIKIRNNGEVKEVNCN